MINAVSARELSDNSLFSEINDFECNNSSFIDELEKDLRSAANSGDRRYKITADRIREHNVKYYVIAKYFENLGYRINENITYYIDPPLIVSW